MVQRDHQQLGIWRQIMAEKNRPNSAAGPERRPKQKNAASSKGSGVFLIMKSLKRKSLSLAGLAATYSPRA